MSIFKLPTILYLLITINLLLLQTVFGDHACLSANNFTTDDPYDKNLNELTAYLAYVISLTGSGIASKGHGKNKVYGLSMCFGNNSQLECKICVTDASSALRSVCGNNKGAVHWRGICSLKYHNLDFFGQFERSTSFGIKGEMNTSDPGIYRQKIGELLSNLTTEAVVSPSMSKSGGVRIGEKEELHGIVYCNGNITSTECKSCLDDSIKFFPQCYDAKTFAAVYGGSCLVAYKQILY